MSWLSSASIDRFSKFASALQSVVTVMGIIAAGLWAYLTFWELGSTQKSSAELEKTRAEIAEIEFRASVLTIDINLDTLVKATGANLAIPINATFRNDGKQQLV